MAWPPYSISRVGERNPDHVLTRKSALSRLRPTSSLGFDLVRLAPRRRRRHSGGARPRYFHSLQFSGNSPQLLFATVPATSESRPVRNFARGESIRNMMVNVARALDQSTAEGTASPPNHLRSRMRR